MRTYLFENPWPVAIVLSLLVAVVVAFSLRSGRRDGVVAAGVLAIAIAAVFGLDAVVVTSGERAEGIVTDLVEAAVAADTATAKSLFARDAEMTFGADEDSAQPIGYIFDAIDQLDGRYRIESNRITRLDSRTISADAAEVHLTCWTELQGGMGGASRTGWVLRVERQPDGSFRITRVRFVDLNDQTPGPGVFR